MTAVAPENPADIPDLIACRSLLAVFPDMLAMLIEQLPAQTLLVVDGPGRWTPQQVLAHLLQIEESSWIPRIRHVYHGGAGSIPLVNPMRHLEQYAARCTRDLLQAFRAQRGQNIDALARLQLDVGAWKRSGLHPEAGRITMGNLVGTWSMHDLDHLVQILQVVGQHGRPLVGPLARYLRICRPAAA